MSKYIITEKQLEEIADLINDLCAVNCFGQFDPEKGELSTLRQGYEIFSIKIEKV